MLCPPLINTGNYCRIFFRNGNQLPDSIYIYLFEFNGILKQRDSLYLMPVAFLQWIQTEKKTPTLMQEVKNDMYSMPVFNRKM